MRPTRLAVVFAAVLAFVCSTFGTAGPAGAVASTTPPSGANNWTCKPVSVRPNPVVLVHGTYGDMSMWGTLSRALVNSGYCVYALNYGNQGTDSMSTSAGELKTFVDRVLASTGAAKVSIVGHSQGGTMPRYYLKNLGGAAKVNDMVSISAANHGTTNTGVTAKMVGYAVCTACSQLVAGSTFLAGLNAGDETPGSVSYTNVVTAYDKVVTPYTSGYLSGPSTTNIRLQDLCPADTASHTQGPDDPAVIRIVGTALASSGPAPATYRPKCTW
jgi:triacylglycerol lipase